MNTRIRNENVIENSYVLGERNNGTLLSSTSDNLFNRLEIHWPGEFVFPKANECFEVRVSHHVGKKQRKKIRFRDIFYHLFQKQLTNLLQQQSTIAFSILWAGIFEKNELSQLKLEKCSSIEKEALQKFFRQRRDDSSECVGIYGLGCENIRQKNKKHSFCSTCFEKQKMVRSRPMQLLMSPLNCSNDEFYYSSMNPLFYPYDKKCATKECKSLIGLENPYCKRCLSLLFGLEIKFSFVSNGGYGLFCTKDFKIVDCLHLNYSGKNLSKADYEKLNIQSDFGYLLAQYRQRYILQISRDLLIDASGPEGNATKFINEAPAIQLTNCKFIMKDAVKIVIIKDMEIGQELLIDYGQAGKKNEEVLYKNTLSTAAITQKAQIAIAELAIAQKKRLSTLSAIFED